MFRIQKKSCVALKDLLCVSLMKMTDNQIQSIAREEWDFSRVPLEQLEACFAWEFARECEWLVGGFKSDLIPPETITVNTGDERKGEYEYEEIENPDYEDYFFSPDDHVGCVRGMMVAENLHKLDTPWQGLLPEVQVEMIKMGTPEVIGMLELSPRSYEFRVAFGLELDRAEKTWFDSAAFRINWDQSDKRLLHDFGAWLKRQRSKSAKELRGRNRRDSLNMLGAMRLLHHMPLQEAIILTTRTLGEPLYGKRPSWERARKSALETYRGEFLTNPSEGDDPLSYPKFIKEPITEKES